MWGVLPASAGVPRKKTSNRPPSQQTSKRSSSARHSPPEHSRVPDLTAESPRSHYCRGGCGAALLGECGGGEEVGADLDQGRGWGIHMSKRASSPGRPQAPLCKAAWLAHVQPRAVRLRAWSALPCSRSGSPDPGPSGKGWEGLRLWVHGPAA